MKYWRPTKLPARPFLVKKRITDKGNLWGVVAESNMALFKIDIVKMLEMMINGIPFLVDYPGADRPSMLTKAHKLTKDGMIFYFKAIGDKNKKNNFANVKAVKIEDVGELIPEL